jgi:hypothetical protein
LKVTGSPPGDLRLEDDADVGLRYVYRSSDALLIGGKNVDAGAGSLSADRPAQVFVTWTEPNTTRIWASTALNVTLDVGQLLGPGAAAAELLRVQPDGKEQPTPISKKNGSSLSLSLQGGDYVLRLGKPPARAADFDVGGGHFFTQTNGRKDSGAGFSVTDEGGVPFWTAFKALGGVDALGYPVTRRFELDGFTVQAFQKSILQWRPDRREFWFVNTFDVLHDRGRDDWLEIYRQTPRPLDTSPDKGLVWERVVDRHLAMLDKAPAALKERFLADPDWLDHYGLPVAVQDYSNSVVVRAQRATLQFWKETVPWAAKGSVSVANGGDLAKEAGLFPWLAVTPENAPR